MHLYSSTYPLGNLCKSACLSANYLAIYLRKCRICVNTHTHTHTHTHILTARNSRVKILLSKEVCKSVYRHFCTLLCIYPDNK